MQDSCSNAYTQKPNCLTAANHRLPFMWSSALSSLTLAASALERLSAIMSAISSINISRSLFSPTKEESIFMIL